MLREKFKQNGYTIHDAIGKLLSISNRVFPTVTLGIIREDPDDNRILECAVTGHADAIVTGDRAMLDLKNYSGVRILSLRRFLDESHTPDS